MKMFYKVVVLKIYMVRYIKEEFYIHTYKAHATY